MSTQSVLPALDMAQLRGFAPQIVIDGAGLEKVSSFIERLRTAPRLSYDRVPAIGIDTETNITVDFYNRRIRTIQLGDASEQFCIDLLAFADGNTQRLIDTQGFYGQRAAGVFEPVLKVIRPVVNTNQFLKVGQNLAFEYEGLRWNLGLRLWSLYSIDIAERVIKAGAHSLKDYPFFSFASIVARYFNKLIDKSLQTTFDLSSPLTQEQVNYATLDVYLPLAVRQKQIKTLESDGLSTTVQIENDAVGSYTDMHLHGQRINRDRWRARIASRKQELVDTLKALDTYFIPVCGNKHTAIDEEGLNQLEKRWRDLDLATEEEKEACTAYKSVPLKNPLRTELKANYEALVRHRKELKAAARVTYMELSKRRTEARKLIDKCMGEALINYNSDKQLLAAFQKMKGYGKIKEINKDYLLKFNNLPLIPLLLKLSKLKKDIGTYGEQWTQEWVTHPCKEEGWLHPGDGRLHCLYNQLEAETGRSSSSRPNAQNLPKEDEIRACFCADEPDENIRVSTCCDGDTTCVGGGTYVCSNCGKLCDTRAEDYVIVTCDMSGAELRIIAELAGAESWIRAFEKGQDVHSVGTEILYPELWPTLTEPGCAYFEIGSDGEPKRHKCSCKGHKKLRDNNKATNFLLAYGGGAKALAETLGITVDEANELLRLHKSKFPDIWGYLERSGRLAVQNRESRDMYGRRRLFPPPTWDGAREWFIQEHSDRLELSQEETAARVRAFKLRAFRDPSDEELYLLSHRDPKSDEISWALRGLWGSIERRGKNAPIQGTNASLAKRIVGCGADADGKQFLWHLLPKFSARLLSFIHDEFVICCPRRHGQAVLDCVRDAIRRAGSEVMKKVVMESEGNIAGHWSK